jgi:glycosyltransferase involved in cell wall biosynthesis
MPQKVLFISHDASRTGAPIVLIHLLRWLKNNSDLDFVILLKDGGSMEHEFQEIAPTFLWNTKQTIVKRITSKLKKIIFKNSTEDILSIRQYRILKKIKKSNINLIYTNTVASHNLIPILKNRIDVPVISHIHEMYYSINTSYKFSFSNDINSLVDHFITVSKIAKKQWVSQVKIPENKVSIINEFIDIAQFQKPSIAAEKIRNDLGIKESFVVGCSGTTTWRKGIDLFINLKRIMHSRNFHDIAFVWLGYVFEETIDKYDYDKMLLGDAIKIYFTGQQNEPMNYFQIFDIFTLTSREDPFPLVCIEAASLSKPIICFENASGIPEEFENKGAITVPYMDLNKMADEICRLYNSKEEKEKIGQMAFDTAKRFDVNEIAPTIKKLIYDKI